MVPLKTILVCHLLVLVSILLLTIFLLPGAFSNLFELNNLSKPSRFERILHENTSTCRNSSSILHLAPALFVIGDSTVDCGANYNLFTIARPNFLPYGRDFDTHLPTGRFCNGRIPVDYLAQKLGLPLVPAFVVPTTAKRGVEYMLHGLNYASGGAGILYFSGSDLGQRVPLAEQIVHARETFQQIGLILGTQHAEYMISQSVFYISIGSNDFIHYYEPNASGVQSHYQPWEFSRLLAYNLIHELKNLYYSNARKVVVMGLAPLGCTPYYLSNNGQCLEEVNNMIVEFNFIVRYMVSKLNQEFQDTKITFCDAYEGSMDIFKNRKQYGFETTTEACCGNGRSNGLLMCIANPAVCGNASTYIWWDEFHPTDAVNAILADDVWSGLHANICYPMNLQDMVA